MAYPLHLAVNSNVSFCDFIQNHNSSRCVEVANVIPLHNITLRRCVTCPYTYVIYLSCTTVYSYRYYNYYCGCNDNLSQLIVRFAKLSNMDHCYHWRVSIPHADITDSKHESTTFKRGKPTLLQSSPFFPGDARWSTARN